MSKSIYDEYLEIKEKEEKLLELYDKLAEYRLIVINKLLDEITDLAHFATTKQFIDYIKYKAKYYRDEDSEIVKEIEKIKEELK